jgi:hypothetical protein
MSENSTPTTLGDLPSLRPHYRKLPAELNRQIYLCFNVATQRKFICGLGWGFYALLRYRLLTKVFCIIDIIHIHKNIKCRMHK